MAPFQICSGLRYHLGITFAAAATSSRWWCQSNTHILTLMANIEMSRVLGEIPLPQRWSTVVSTNRNM